MVKQQIVLKPLNKGVELQVQPNHQNHENAKQSPQITLKYELLREMHQL